MSLSRPARWSHSDSAEMSDSKRSILIAVVLSGFVTSLVWWFALDVAMAAKLADSRFSAMTYRDKFELASKSNESLAQKHSSLLRAVLEWKDAHPDERWFDDVAP
jgi:hypothetical protein